MKLSAYYICQIISALLILRCLCIWFRDGAFKGGHCGMVVQYCQTYTDREHGKILTYDLYSSYGSWKGFTVLTVRTENDFKDRTNRTVREKDLRIVNTAFQSVKESRCD